MERGEEGEGCWGKVDLVGEGEGAKDCGDEGAGGLCPHCLVLVVVLKDLNRAKVKIHTRIDAM